jgi:hypothetical protein
LAGRPRRDRASGAVSAGVPPTSGLSCSLFEAVLAFFQFPGTGYAFAMAVMPVIILLYLNSTAVKVAFGIKDPPPAA